MTTNDTSNTTKGIPDGEFSRFIDMQRLQDLLGGMPSAEESAEKAGELPSGVSIYASSLASAYGEYLDAKYSDGESTAANAAAEARAAYREICKDAEAEFGLQGLSLAISLASPELQRGMDELAEGVGGLNHVALWAALELAGKA